MPFIFLLDFSSHFTYMMGILFQYFNTIAFNYPFPVESVVFNKISQNLYVYRLLG